MNISLDGSNVFQTGNTVAEYSITPAGAVGLSGYNAGWQQYQDLQNAMSAAVDSQLTQQYSNLFSQTFNTRKKQALDAYQICRRHRPRVAEWRHLSRHLSRPAPSDDCQSDPRPRGHRRHASDVLHPMGRLGPPQRRARQSGAMLPQVSAAVSAFYNALAALGVENKVTLFTISDFGRTLTSNSRGSDHAWGGNQMVVGGAVAGKRIFGSYPSLALNPGERPRGEPARHRARTVHSHDKLRPVLRRTCALAGREARPTCRSIFPNLGNFLQHWKQRAAGGISP